MDNRQRVEAYFSSCASDSAAGIAAHFTADAIVYDTNHKPLIGADAIGKFWAEVRERWCDAVWYVDSYIADDQVAAIEWTMTGTTEHGAFTVRGSEHYQFDRGLIKEIRQYWTFRRDKLNSALVGFPYAQRTGYFVG